MSIKTWVRKWLDIDPPAPAAARTPAAAIDKAFGKIGELNRDQVLLESDLRDAKADAGNALGQIMQLQQKFDALAHALGIYVVFSDQGDAAIESTRENGLMGDATRYIEAALLSKEFMSSEYRMLELRRQVLRDFAKELAGGLGGARHER